ncbi:MAG: YicC family protein, partial [Chthonomonadaceae bacterium]|nr:YicC family protein [Chthonomonadaceae bacterium]
MIHSMTGFATRTFSFKDETYKIELKSLNHRFLDLKLRTPRNFNSFDASIKSLIEGKLKRGSVEVWVEKLSQNKNENAIRVNEEQAQAAFKVLDDLRKKFH